jgi:hypothetical protein
VNGGYKKGFYSTVMVALVATIHDFLRGAETSGGQKKTWMVGPGGRSRPPS